VVAGFEALVRCEHTEAIALARTGKMSGDQNHRLASLWLEALIAADAGTSPDLERVIEADSDIGGEDQAKKALGDVVAKIDAERRASGIECG
jgi:hypothetical protein